MIQADIICGIEALLKQRSLQGRSNPATGRIKDRLELIVTKRTTCNQMLQRGSGLKGVRSLGEVDQRAITAKP